MAKFDDNPLQNYFGSKLGSLAPAAMQQQGGSSGKGSIGAVSGKAPFADLAGYTKEYKSFKPGGSNYQLNVGPKPLDPSVDPNRVLTPERKQQNPGFAPPAPNPGSTGPVGPQVSFAPGMAYSPNPNPNVALPYVGTTGTPGSLGVAQPPPKVKPNFGDPQFGGITGGPDTYTVGGIPPKAPKPMNPNEWAFGGPLGPQPYPQAPVSTWAPAKFDEGGSINPVEQPSPIGVEPINTPEVPAGNQPIVTIGGPDQAGPSIPALNKPEIKPVPTVPPIHQQVPPSVPTGNPIHQQVPEQVPETPYVPGPSGPGSEVQYPTRAGLPATGSQTPQTGPYIPGRWSAGLSQRTARLPEGRRPATSGARLVEPGAHAALEDGVQSRRRRRLRSLH
jgi:hypothetical protein